MAVVLSVFLDLHFLITPLVSSDDQAVYIVMNLHVSNEDKYVFMLVYMVELFDFVSFKVLVKNITLKHFLQQFFLYSKIKKYAFFG